jgi:hypothetical protein
MAEEKQASAAKVFFVKHGEKVGLGVAALALVAYLVMGVLMAKEDPTPNQVSREVKRIKSDKESPHPEDPDFKSPDVKPWSDIAVKPWNNVVASARGGNDYAGSALPELVYKEDKPPPVQIRGVRIPEIVFGNVEVALDSVTVSWTVKNFTLAEERAITTREKADILKIKEVVVERQVNGGKWEEVARVDPKTTTFKDTKIEPKSKYNYRVTSIPEPDKLNRPEAKGMTVGTSTPASTLGIWKVSFSNPSKPAGSAKGMVYVTIEKYEKGRGKVEKRRIHYAGDKIGWWAETEGAEPTSLHLVSEGGRSFKVDFNTGMDLVSIEPAKVTVDIKKCKPEFDKTTGNKIGCKEVIEKRGFDVYEIVYKDEDGTHKVHSPNPRDSARGQDELCEDHGGKKIIAVLPGPKPDRPDEPKVDPAVVKAQKREADADKIYKDAEKAEAAKNKAQAIALYEKLLTEFADTEFVSKGKKAVIEERLAVLKQ